MIHRQSEPTQSAITALHSIDLKPYSIALNRYPLREYYIVPRDFPVVLMVGLPDAPRDADGSLLTFLTEYVECGGTLIITSNWSWVAERAFPALIGSRGVDLPLAKQFWKTPGYVTLDFDSNRSSVPYQFQREWVYEPSDLRSVFVLARDERNWPVVMGMDQGKGRVFYTSLSDFYQEPARRSLEEMLKQATTRGLIKPPPPAPRMQGEWSGRRGR